MDKVLELVFRNAAGTEVTINLPNPKDGLTNAVVKPVMENIVKADIFASKGNFALAQIVEARIRNTDVSPLA